MALTKGGHKAGDGEKLWRRRKVGEGEKQKL
jgi:hypothetical protein